jgi:hypothetical protein
MTGFAGLRYMCMSTIFNATVQWTSPYDSQCLGAQEHIEIVKKDFRLIFKDIMDKDHFESNIYFRDPMTTNLNFFRGAHHCLLLLPCCHCWRLQFW